MATCQCVHFTEPEWRSTFLSQLLREKHGFIMNDNGVAIYMKITGASCSEEIELPSYGLLSGQKLLQSVCFYLFTPKETPRHPTPILWKSFSFVGFPLPCTFSLESALTPRRKPHDGSFQ